MVSSDVSSTVESLTQKEMKNDLMLHKGTHEQSEHSLTRQFLFPKRAHHNPKKVSRHAGGRKEHSFGLYSKAGGDCAFLPLAGL